MGPVREFPGLLREHRLGPIHLELLFNPGLHFLIGRSRGRFHVRDLQNGETLGRGHGGRRRHRFGGKRGIHEGRRIANAGKRLGAGEVTDLDHLQAMILGGLIHAAGARVGFDRTGQRLGRHFGFIADECGLDLRLGFGQGLQVGFGLIVDMQDVEAVIGLNDAAGLPFGGRESALFKLGNGASAGNGTEKPSVGSACRILRVLLRQRREIGLRVELFQNVLGLGARLGGGLGVHLAVRAGRRSTNQNMTHRHRFGNPKLFLMSVVVTLQIFRRDLGRVRQLRLVDRDVNRLALFRGAVRVLRLRLFVERPQFGVGRLQLFGHVVRRDHGIVELHLGVDLAELPGQLIGRDAGASLDNIAQFINRDLPLQLVFELRNGQVEVAPDKRLVLLGADEIAVREKLGRKPAVLQFVAQLFVAGAQTHAIGFVQQKALHHQRFGGLLQQIGAKLRRRSMRELAAGYLVGLLIDVLSRNLLGSNLGDEALMGDPELIENASGNQGDDHHDADDGQKADQQYLLNRAFGLQKSNHFL